MQKKNNVPWFVDVSLIAGGLVSITQIEFPIWFKILVCLANLVFIYDLSKKLYVHFKSK